jgi:hypothetical protein
VTVPFEVEQILLAVVLSLRVVVAVAFGMAEEYQGKATALHHDIGSGCTLHYNAQMLSSGRLLRREASITYLGCMPGLGRGHFAEAVVFVDSRRVLEEC